MPMIPFFPPLQPSVPNRYWFDMVVGLSEEAQTSRYEDERRNWRESLKTTATDLQPLGKVLTIPGIETDDEDGDGNDDSEDSESHDEEDDDANDRVIPVAQDFYSVDDIQMNDETSGRTP